jgi:hypothetical protein
MTKSGRNPKKHLFFAPPSVDNQITKICAQENTEVPQPTADFSSD